jgi:ASC-1-like (ASCH) protein
MIDSLGEDLRMVLDKNLFMNLHGTVGKDIECDLMDKLYNKILRSDIFKFKNNMLRVVFLNLKSKGIYDRFFR